MTSKIKAQFKEILSPFFTDDKNERNKFLLLGLCFFMIIACFSILKPLKNPVFFRIVGGGAKPLTRFISLPILALAMFLYSFIVDKIRRYQVLILFTAIYAVGNLFFAFLLNSPIFGLVNTEESIWRILGWTFYIYLDLYQVFVVSTFWSFANSINSPDGAKKMYGPIVAISKVAGITTPILSDLYLSKYVESTAALCYLIAFTSILLAIASFAIAYLNKKVPGYCLHGYEAVYQLEKQKSKEESKQGKKGTGIWEGIKITLTNSYSFGIFIIVASYEIISEVIDYKMMCMVDDACHHNVVSFTRFNLYYTSAFQGLGLFFALFGTGWALKYFDVKKSLIIAPIASLFLISCLFAPSLSIVVGVMVVLRALNYGFNVPVREILYIPTVKDIKFKAKGWISSFGRNISKAGGSGLNIMIRTFGFNSALFAILGIGCIWTATSIAVGTKYMKTIKENGTIGE